MNSEHLDSGVCDPHKYLYKFKPVLRHKSKQKYEVKDKETTRCEKYAVLLPQHVSGTNMPIIRVQLILVPERC
jgi:hypothetical protein